MLMPGRSGFSTLGGWGTGGTTSTGLPNTLTVGTRVTGTLEYKAGQSIEFTEGFESQAGDEYTAYTTTEQSTGSGGTVNGVDGVEGQYRYGFNGQEKSNEISGEGNSYTAEFWEYNPRIGRRWNVDPIPKTSISGYAVLGNNPILFIDPNGADWYQNNKTGDSKWFDGHRKHKGFTYLGGENYVFKTAGSDLSEVFVTAKTPKKEAKPSNSGHNWLNWPSYPASGREVQNWNNIMFARQRDGQKLVQGNEPSWVLGELNFHKRNFQADKDWRNMSYGAVGILGGPLVLMGAVETGATAYLYQGSSWIVRNYGVSFAQEFTKEALANRFQFRKMDWSDIMVSTLASKWNFHGVKPIVELINATNDFTIDSKWQNSFLGTKDYRQTGIDLLFSAWKLKHEGKVNSDYMQMYIDQIKYQTNEVLSPK